MTALTKSACEWLESTIMTLKHWRGYPYWTWVARQPIMRVLAIAYSVGGEYRVPPSYWKCWCHAYLNQAVNSHYKCYLSTSLQVLWHAAYLESLGTLILGVWQSYTTPILQVSYTGCHHQWSAWGMPLSCLPYKVCHLKLSVYKRSPSFWQCMECQCHFGNVKVVSLYPGSVRNVTITLTV